MRVKTHLIVTDQYDEYEVKWHKQLINTNPDMSRNVLQFILIRHSGGRVEVSTFDLAYLEKVAKRFAWVKGRGSVTTDRVDIYLLEVDGNEKFMATVVKRHIRQYAPMYDEI